MRELRLTRVRGVPQDYVQAHMWASIRVTTGERDGMPEFLPMFESQRDNIELNMTPAQVAKSGALVREWHLAHPWEPTEMQILTLTSLSEGGALRWLQWLRGAAEQGYAYAQVNLGRMYREGWGVPQDDAEAVRWYRLAAAQGHANAQIGLAMMYGFGQGVPQDDAEMVRWYRLAAAQGNAYAHYPLGLLYAEGRGVPRDDAEAVRWYRLSAEQGYADAQTTLGFMYTEGRGVPQDYTEAVRWYRLAAEQGNAGGQYRLGIMFRNGRGVPQDHVQAHVWFNLAASRQTGENREFSVTARDGLEARMTPDQLAEAQRLAGAWDGCINSKSC